MLFVQPAEWGRWKEAQDCSSNSSPDVVRAVEPHELPESLSPFLTIKNRTPSGVKACSLLREMEIRFRLTDGELEFKARPNSQIRLWGSGAKGFRDWMMIGDEGHRTLERGKRPCFYEMTGKA